MILQVDPELSTSSATLLSQQNSGGLGLEFSFGFGGVGSRGLGVQGLEVWDSEDVGV